MTTHVLVVNRPTTHTLPDVFGPFESIEEAQTFAEHYRKLQPDLADLIEATPENNERWTDLGWWFGIVPLSKTLPGWEGA